MTSKRAGRPRPGDITARRLVDRLETAGWASIGPLAGWRLRGARIVLAAVASLQAERAGTTPSQIAQRSQYSETHTRSLLRLLDDRFELVRWGPGEAVAVIVESLLRLVAECEAAALRATDRRSP